MTRGQTRNNQHKPKDKLSQTPQKDIQQDSIDTEFSEEIAEIEDKETHQRSRAADQHAHRRNHS